MTTLPRPHSKLDLTISNILNWNGHRYNQLFHETPSPTVPLAPSHLSNATKTVKKDNGTCPQINNLWESLLPGAWEFSNFERIHPTKWDWEGLSPTVVAARDVVNSPRAVTSHSAQSYFTTFFQEPSHILFRELLTNKWSRDHPLRMMSPENTFTLGTCTCSWMSGVTFSVHRPWFQAHLPRVLMIACLSFFISLENQV